jgi:hypothetical protein
VNVSRFLRQTKIVVIQDYKASRYKSEARVHMSFELLLPFLSPPMQMFSFTKRRVVVRLSYVRRYYFNKRCQQPSTL